jgi:hypothetical protein
MSASALSIAERFLSEVCEAFILSYGNEKQAPPQRVNARFDGAYFRFEGSDYYVLEQQNPNDPDHRTFVCCFVRVLSECRLCFSFSFENSVNRLILANFPRNLFPSIDFDKCDFDGNQYGISEEDSATVAGGRTYFLYLPAAELVPDNERKELVKRSSKLLKAAASKASAPPPTTITANQAQQPPQQPTPAAKPVAAAVAAATAAVPTQAPTATTTVKKAVVTPSAAAMMPPPQTNPTPVVPVVKLSTPTSIRVSKSSNDALAAAAMPPPVGYAAVIQATAKAPPASKASTGPKLSFKSSTVSATAAGMQYCW